jgi:hypothetical protein
VSSELTPADLSALALRAERLAADMDAACRALRRATAGDDPARRVLYGLESVSEQLREAADAIIELAEDRARRSHDVLSYVWRDVQLNDAELKELERDAERLNLMSWKAWLQHRVTCTVCRAALETFGLAAGEPGPIGRYPKRELALTAALCETGRRVRGARHRRAESAVDGAADLHG